MRRNPHLRTKLLAAIETPPPKGQATWDGLALAQAEPDRADYQRDLSVADSDASRTGFRSIADSVPMIADSCG